VDELRAGMGDDEILAYYCRINLTRPWLPPKAHTTPG
jgi:hypothetical protein